MTSEIQTDDKLKTKRFSKASKTPSMHLGTNSTSLWNCNRGISTICPKEVPSVSVLSMAVERNIEHVTPNTGLRSVNF